MAFAFATHGASQPHAAAASASDWPIRLNHTNANLPNTTVYGVAPYYSCVVCAAVQQGELSPYQGRSIWIHLSPEATRFYAAASNGVASMYADDASGGFQIPVSDTPPPKYENGPAVTFVRFSITTIFSPLTTLRGTSVYAFNSDVAKVAFHSGLSNVLTMVNAFVFDIGTTPYLFASTCYGVVSSSTTSIRAVYMSYDPRPSLITNDTLTRFRVTPTPVSGSIYGTTYYTQSSDLTAATLHAGLGTLGVLVEVYVTLIGTRSIFYSSARYGFVSLAGTTSTSAFCLSLTPSRLHWGGGHRGFSQFLTNLYGTLTLFDNFCTGFGHCSPRVYMVLQSSTFFYIFLHLSSVAGGQGVHYSAEAKAP
jgi:hypothetical protein